MDKFDKLYEKVLEIIDWAYDERHISAEAQTILAANIQEAREDVANED